MYPKINIIFLPDSSGEHWTTSGFLATQEEVEEALIFNGPTVVGRLFESAHDVNAAALFSGYFIFWFNKKHRQLSGRTLENCEHCSLLQCDVADINIHGFTFFKDYSQTFDNTGYLKYCSKDFMNVIIEYERIFLYFFSKYRHYHSFVKSLCTFAMAYGKKPKLCTEELYQRILRHFFKTRTFQSVKKFNRSLQKNKSVADKLVKLKNK